MQTFYKRHVNIIRIEPFIEILNIERDYYNENWHSSKKFFLGTILTSDELKTSGNRKLRRAHNSCKLFCKGVPVSKRRLAVLNSRTISDNFDFSFLIRWASSMTMYRQLNFLKTDFSFITISYEVTHTSHFPGNIVSRIIALWKNVIQDEDRKQ